VVVYFRHRGKGAVILDTFLSGLLVLYHVGLFQQYGGGSTPHPTSWFTDR